MDEVRNWDIDIITCQKKGMQSNRPFTCCCQQCQVPFGKTAQQFLIKWFTVIKQLGIYVENKTCLPKSVNTDIWRYLFILSISYKLSICQESESRNPCDPKINKNKQDIAHINESFSKNLVKNNFKILYTLLLFLYHPYIHELMETRREFLGFVDIQRHY